MIALDIDPAKVFAAVENDRQSGRLAARVSGAAFRYQSSRSHPGALEQIAADGTRRVGVFREGEFHPLAPESVRADDG